MATYADYSKAEIACMTLGATLVWAIIAPERFGCKMKRGHNLKRSLAINKLRSMTHEKPNSGFTTGFRNRRLKKPSRNPYGSAFRTQLSTGFRPDRHPSSD